MGDPQRGYFHGNITPHEARLLLDPFDPAKDGPDILFCDLDWRARVKRVISRPIEQWYIGEDPHRQFDGEEILQA